MKRPLLLVFLVTAPLFANHDRFHSDSGVKGPPYDQLVATLHALPAAYPGLVTTGVYGRSVAGRPLVYVKIAKPLSKKKERRVVAMTGVIHGNEYLAIPDRLPVELLRDPKAYPAVTGFLDDGGMLYLMPVVNPDGYEARRRTNDNGVDLNRDFDVKRYIERIAKALAGEIKYTEYEFQTLKAYVDRKKFTEPETRQLAAWMKDELPAVHGRLKVAFDYHCCQDENHGSLMHSWGDTKTLRDGTIPEHDVVRFERAAAHFKDVFPGHPWGSGYEIVQYLTFGTTDEWFYEAFAPDGALAFCYEGQRNDESRKLKQHAQLWDRLLRDPAVAAD